MEKLRADQEEQSANYAKAMKEFQEQYVKQQAIYQQGLEEQQRQIQDWNRVSFLSRFWLTDNCEHACTNIPIYKQK